MLTEEQKRKIEENRLKALKKLEEKNVNSHQSPTKRKLTSTMQSSSPHLKSKEQMKVGGGSFPIFKTSFSPAFKQKTQPNNNSNATEIMLCSPSSKMIPKTSFSPKFKNSTTHQLKSQISNQTSCRRSIVDSLNDVSEPATDNELLLKQRAEENRWKALAKLKNKQTVPTITDKYNLPLTEQKRKNETDLIDHSFTLPARISSTSYSPSFKKRKIGREEEKNSINIDVCILPSMNTNRPKTSYSPSFIKKYPDDVFSEPSKTVVESCNSNKVSVFDALSKAETFSKTIIEPSESSDAAEAKQRAEENRLKALEKLKNKQTAPKPTLQPPPQERLSQQIEGLFFWILML